MRYNKKMKKLIVFFDGDGTLWYPKKTKRKKHPVWLYKDKRYKNYTKHLVLTPSVVSTLEKLKKHQIITVVLSTHPQPPKKANKILKEKINYFHLSNLFDETHATKEYPESKGEFIVKILKERNIPRKKALMVGDSFEWDYNSAREKGVDALLINSDYEKTKINEDEVKKLSDAISYVL
jgi:phosphoglycolate phosphatase-like HAD superfamily hydrolase